MLHCVDTRPCFPELERGQSTVPSGSAIAQHVLHYRRKHSLLNVIMILSSLKIQWEGGHIESRGRKIIFVAIALTQSSKGIAEIELTNRVKGTAEESSIGDDRDVMRENTGWGAKGDKMRLNNLRTCCTPGRNDQRLMSDDV